jgi:hypothetical protein
MVRAVPMALPEATYLSPLMTKTLTSSCLWNTTFRVELVEPVATMESLAMAALVVAVDKDTLGRF